MALMSKHYHRLKRIRDYREIDDVLFKFSLNLPDSDIPNLVDKLHVSLDGIMKPVTSGFGFVDLIIPGLHKANGISRLLKRWKMLKLVKYNFAMGNAAQSIKTICRYSTDDNNHQGALNVIQAVLDDHSPFDA